MKPRGSIIRTAAAEQEELNSAWDLTVAPESHDETPSARFPPAAACS